MQTPRCREKFREGSLGFNFTQFFFASLALGIALRIPSAALAAPAPSASTVSVAAAANLIYVLDALDAAFTRQGDHSVVTIASGASGNLAAQIRNGAPYDVFLSADPVHIRSLIVSGHADEQSFAVFAHGQLVLWTTRPSIRLTEIATAINDTRVNRIAIANPITAPYGAAAKAVLDRLNLWSAAQTRLVFGESIAQTAQFVETGNADIGFVALSLVLAPQLKNKGQWIPVPDELHPPLLQAAVLTERGTKNPAAKRYLAFLRGEEARQILKRFGYLIPE
ncbi:MAG: molybdate ABC transporter substrate-binding protein [Opitutus sp.]